MALFEGQNQANQPPRSSLPEPRAFQTRTRTLQFRGQRTSLRLENVFWEYLESAARHAGSQLGPMIGRMAEKFVGGNLSSHLRAACMLHALKNASSPATDRSLAISATDLFHMTPSPGLLASPSASILDANGAFLDWLRKEKEQLLGENLGSLLRLQQGQSFARFWETLTTTRTPASARMALMLLPGRLAAAEVLCVRLSGDERADSQYVVWFKAAAQARRAPTAG
jgi:predicted DNA-binding ribbon-helix-helix protein